jgi:hypothetical protein
MTEAEWLDPEVSFRDLLRSGDGAMGERKTRLFVCACLRQAWLLLEEPCRQAVEVAERSADERATEEEVHHAWRKSWEITLLGVGSPANGVALLALASWPRLTAEDVVVGCNRIVNAVLGEAEYRWATGQLGYEEYQGLEGRLRAAQEALFRDIAGNPFRSHRLDPAWLTANDALVPRLAGEIYDERRWAELPVLGDALEDAGCDRGDLIDHCHGPGPHTRGCWVLDRLLGKQGSASE